VTGKIAGMESQAVRNPLHLGPLPDRLFGLAHCLIDRDGRVIGCNQPIGNGPLLEQAPATAQILRELVAGVPASHLRDRAVQVLERIDAGRERVPGEDDE
jgi:hypothetical protein